MLTPASIKRRFFSLSYESLLVMAVAIVVGLLAGGVNTFIVYNLPTLSFLNHSLTTFILLLGWWYYFKLNWVREGQTLPMRVWRIVLVDDAGNRPKISRLRLRFIWATVFLLFIPLCVYAGLRHGGLAVGRALALALCWWILPWGFAFFHPRKQFLYDYLAGTELVNMD